MRRLFSSALMPKWSPRFFDSTASQLQKFGLSIHDEIIEDVDLLSGARFEAEDIFGKSVGVWKDLETKYEGSNEPPEQLLSFVKSIVTQFPSELNNRIPGLNLSTSAFSSATSQLFGAGIPDEFSTDVQNHEEDPRVVSVVCFLNLPSIWRQSYGGHWRFDSPNLSSKGIEPTFSPLAGTVLVYWARKTPFQILSYNVPEEHKLISLHVWLHSNQPSNK
jgi:hypothetical protein